MLHIPMRLIASLLDKSYQIHSLKHSIHTSTEQCTYTLNFDAYGRSKVDSLDTLGDTFEMEIKKTDYTRKNSQNGTNRAQMETIFEGLFLYIVQRTQVTENRFVVIKMNCLNETKLTFGKTNKSLTYTCVHQIWFYFVGFIKNPLAL